MFPALSLAAVVSQVRASVGNARKLRRSLHLATFCGAKIVASLSLVTGSALGPCAAGHAGNVSDLTPFWHTPFSSNQNQRLTHSAKLRKTLMVVLCQIRSDWAQQTGSVRRGLTPASRHGVSRIPRRKTRRHTKAVPRNATLGVSARLMPHCRTSRCIGTLTIAVGQPSHRTVLSRRIRKATDSPRLKRARIFHIR